MKKTAIYKQTQMIDKRNKCKAKFKPVLPPTEEVENHSMN